MSDTAEMAYEAADRVGIAAQSVEDFKQTVHEYTELQEMAASGALYAETDMDEGDAERFLESYEATITEYVEDVLPCQLQKAATKLEVAEGADAFAAVSDAKYHGSLDPDLEAVQETLEEAEDLDTYAAVARDLTGKTVDQHRQTAFPRYREEQNRKRMAGL